MIDEDLDQERQHLLALNVSENAILDEILTLVPLCRVNMRGWPESRRRLAVLVTALSQAREIVVQGQ